MASLCAPLPTLRRRPRGCLRTAWGRCGLLLLHRSGLAPPTSCRSPGARLSEFGPLPRRRRLRRMSENRVTSAVAKILVAPSPNARAGASVTAPTHNRSQAGRGGKCAIANHVDVSVHVTGISPFYVCCRSCGRTTNVLFHRGRARCVRYEGWDAHSPKPYRDGRHSAAGWAAAAVIDGRRALFRRPARPADLDAL